MDPHIGAAIVSSLASAASFVTENMPVGMSSEEVYEALFEGQPEVLRAFREAVRYLPTAETATQYISKLDMMLCLRPTSKYPQYLMPKDIRLSPESKLMTAMALPTVVATRWELLKKVWEHMHTMDLSMTTYAHLFPWLRELAPDLHIPYSRIKTKTQQQLIKRQLAELECVTVPKSFPSMTNRLNAICKSGDELFTQYRMLRATHALAERQPVCMSPSLLTLPDWLKEELKDVTMDWQQRQLSPYGVHNGRIR